MARSPLPVLGLAILAFVILSTLNVHHQLGPSLFELWADNDDFQLLSSRAGERGLGDEYLLGVGKSDITGPVVEVNFMGYADLNQIGTGLRQRLFSRAFIVGDLQRPKERIVYLVLDIQSGDTAVRYGILQGLKDLGDEYSMYGQHNVAVIGTHSHSGPGAWLNYLLPQITSKGFDKPSYNAIVQGALASIKQAHERLAPGHLAVGSDELLNTNINRSPWAYLQNPEEERARYSYDVDKTMTVLRFSHTTATGEKDIGVLTWFPVHGTSMYGNNTLVTGDNKGVAAVMLEKFVGDSLFVAGFSQANVGDTTPNVLGAYCESGPQAGEMCDFKTSLCGDKNEPCHGRGPYFGRNDAGTASNYEIGIRQFNITKTLLGNASAFTPIQGKVVRSLHQFVDLSNYEFPLSNGTVVRTCPAALGYSFAAGTSDGPGAFDFKQGQPDDPNANPVWGVVSGLLHAPNKTQIACQREKPILLDVGETTLPYDWAPNIVDMQLLRIGQLFMIISPGEATTMSGRRWKEALSSSAAASLDDIPTDLKPVVVLGGPANTYAHYIATPEEYSAQRYEGASTLYGPWTLDAYINLTLTNLPRLSTAARSWPQLDPGPFPPIYVNKSLSFINPVVVDAASLFKSFGDVVHDVESAYISGDTVSATFVGANPRNNFRLGETFASVERFNANTSTWEVFRDDEDWSLVYKWKRISQVLGTSETTISWETKWESDAWRGEDGQSEPDATHTDLLIRDQRISGRYRLRYYGDAKAIGGAITAFEGTSGEFTIQ